MEISEFFERWLTIEQQKADALTEIAVTFAGVEVPSDGGSNTTEPPDDSNTEPPNDGFIDWIKTLKNPYSDDPADNVACEWEYLEDAKALYADLGKRNKAKPPRIELQHPPLGERTKTKIGDPAIGFLKSILVDGGPAKMLIGSSKYPILFAGNDWVKLTGYYDHRTEEWRVVNNGFDPGDSLYVKPSEVLRELGF